MRLLGCGLPGLANTGRPVPRERQINKYVSTAHDIFTPKQFVVYPTFEFNWGPRAFLGSRLWSSSSLPSNAFLHPRGSPPPPQCIPHLGDSLGPLTPAVSSLALTSILPALPGPLPPTGGSAWPRVAHCPGVKSEHLTLAHRTDWVLLQHQPCSKPSSLQASAIKASRKFQDLGPFHNHPGELECSS